VIHGCFDFLCLCSSFCLQYLPGNVLWSFHYISQKIKWNYFCRSSDQMLERRYVYWFKLFVFLMKRVLRPLFIATIVIRYIKNKVSIMLTNELNVYYWESMAEMMIMWTSSTLPVTYCESNVFMPLFCSVSALIDTEKIPYVRATTLRIGMFHPVL